MSTGRAVRKARGRNCRCLPVALKPGVPLGHRRDFRSGWTRSGCGQPGRHGPELSVVGPRLEIGGRRQAGPAGAGVVEAGVVEAGHRKGSRPKASRSGRGRRGRGRPPERSRPKASRSRRGQWDRRRSGRGRPPEGSRLKASWSRRGRRDRRRFGRGQRPEGAEPAASRSHRGQRGDAGLVEAGSQRGRGWRQPVRPDLDWPALVDCWLGMRPLCLDGCGWVSS